MIGTIHSKSSLSAAFDNRLSFGERSHAVGKGARMPFVSDVFGVNYYLLLV